MQELTFNFKQCVSCCCSGQSGAEDEERSERTHILGLWQHFGLCMTVPGLESSQDSCRHQAGLSVVMEGRVEGKKCCRQLSSSSSYPFLLVLLVFKGKSSQPLFGIFGTYILYICMYLITN